ncbi:MAG TPA: signal peptidase I [Solirubrobacteraceae bacterium]|jgi:signal peptidase I|nr:signal peptidase I [Solirubrobacteraceae bacterium]
MGVRSAKGSAKGVGAANSADGGTTTRASAVGKGPAPAPKRAKSTTSSLVELVVIIAIAVLLAIGIQAFIIKPYRIPSGSMEPTLIKGQRVLVDRIGMDFGKPHVGEIAVFHPPEGAENEQCGPVARTTITFGGAPCDQTNPQEASVNFIKRIVAGPGDSLYVKEGHVYRAAAGTNRFVRESDPYIKPCGGVQECNFTTPIKIPAGHWFMMGDNRGESDDSRFWGPVPTSWIIGDAFATYWPPDRIGTL